MQTDKRRLTQDDYEQAADIINIVDSTLKTRFEVFNRLWIEYLAVCAELDGLRTPKPALQSVAEEPVKIGSGIFAPGVKIWSCPSCGVFLTPTHKYCWRCGQALNYELSTQEKE